MMTSRKSDDDIITAKYVINVPLLLDLITYERPDYGRPMNP